jgi:hypothetical protein
MLIALALVFAVLLVPVVKWARDKWMAKTVELTIYLKDFDDNNVEVSVTASTWAGMIESLMAAGRSNGCRCEEWDVCGALLKQTDYVTSQLESEQAWEMLATHLGHYLDSYANQAISKERWQTALSLWNWCSAGVRAKILDGLKGCRIARAISI